MVTVRRYAETDADALGRVMFDAIRTGTSPYSEAQRVAWLARVPTGTEWAARLAGSKVWVAEDRQAVLGFLTMYDTGYIDLAFVRASAQGRGVFSALYSALEKDARAAGLPRLRTHASLMAQPAFEARGFHVIGHETVERGSEVLARAEMEKSLT